MARLVKRLGYELRLEPCEPDWDLLGDFGLPLGGARPKDSDSAPLSESLSKRSAFSKKFSTKLPTKESLISAPGQTPDRVKQFRRELRNAILFLSAQEDKAAWGRHFDAVKGLLLALKFHYPTEFARLKHLPPPDPDKVFALYSVEGRHIKLRNIALGLVSQRCRTRS